MSTSATVNASALLLSIATEATGTVAAAIVREQRRKEREEENFMATGGVEFLWMYGIDFRSVCRSVDVLRALLFCEPSDGLFQWLVLSYGCPCGLLEPGCKLQVVARPKKTPSYRFRAPLRSDSDEPRPVPGTMINDYTTNNRLLCIIPFLSRRRNHNLAKTYHKQQ